MSRALTVRLDDEADAALRELEEESPELSTADVVRGAITEKRSCVYFVRRSDGAIKIGWSASLPGRLSALRYEVGHIELLAVMPGGRAEEKELHDAHQEEWVAGEWFRGASVEAEVAGVLAEWGPPDAKAWRGARNAFGSMVVDGDTLHRLERHQARLKARAGRIRISKQCVVRDLLLIGLHAAEHDETRANQS